MLFIYRMPRYHATTPEEERVEKSQTYITDTKNQEIMTLELRDIRRTTRSDEKSFVHADFILFRGDDKERFTIKLGCTHRVNDNLAVHFAAFMPNGAASIGLCADKWIDIARADIMNEVA